MCFTSESTPSLEVGSVVNVFNPEMEASARDFDLCENGMDKMSRFDRARKKH